MRRLWFVVIAGLGVAGCDHVAADGPTPQNRAGLAPGVIVAESERPKKVNITKIHRDLFGAPSEERAIARPVTPSPPHPVTQSPPPTDPLAGWEYVGDVEVGGERLALVERKDTKEGLYLRAGDP